MNYRSSFVDCRFVRRLVVFIVLLALSLWAQAPPKAQPTPPKPDVPPKAQQPSQPPAQAEHRITPEEAKQLLGAVDEVLHFDSTDTGLRIKHDVKRQLADREQVQKYIQDRLNDDEDTQRLRRAEVVLKKLGLLPGDFDLQTFLVELMREQVAGYYDSKTKTVYLLDWLQPAAQLPVMAHELTHALQDQNYGLEKWIDRGTSEKTPTEAARGDEEIAARHAVVEGQAMAVMINYLLAPTGGSVVTMPSVTKAIQQGMMEGADSPVFNKAPLFIKQMLVFPYRYGLDFERELLMKGGKDKAFAGVFKSPPENTRQIMEPATYLAGEKLAELPVPDIAKLLGKAWEKYDVGSIGEFDVASMAEIYASEDVAAKIYPQWRGGWYYALKRKGHTISGPDDIALVLVTRWANEKAAHDFAVSYYNSIPNKRYQITASLNAQPPTWATASGAVSLIEHGDTMVAIESVPAETVEKIRQAILGNQR